MKSNQTLPARKPRGAAGIPKIKRVLVTTDFSPLGNEAIPFAYSLLPAGGAVLLLHVVEPYELPGPMVPHYERNRPTKREVTQYKKQSMEQLEALIPSQPASPGIESKVEVVEARRPARAICEAANRFGADVICIASHGRSGLLQAVLGSVACDVVARSKRPVLVVRPRR